MPVVMIGRQSIDGSMVQIVNPDGTVTTIDDQGTQITRLGGQVMSYRVDPDRCKHRNAYIVYDDADGRSYHCNECGSLLDENFEIVLRGDREPEY